MSETTAVSETTAISECHDYSKAYFHLFNVVTTQISRMERLLKIVTQDDYWVAWGIGDIVNELIRAQILTEAMYLDGADE